MRSTAEKLAEDFKFVRVDFYLVDGKIYLSEMTFTPGNAKIAFRNKSHNRMLGDMLDIT